MIARELRDASFQRRLLLFNAAVPGAWLAADFARHRLGANPAEALTRGSGVLALIFLTLTLAVTPLARRYRWTWLPRHRRLLGLAAFWYALFHLLTYLGFDRDWDLAGVPDDVAKRPFILVGMFCFFLMIPLAITSTNAMIRRLGRDWKRLHRLTYLIAVGGVAHYALIVKSDFTYPLAFGLAIGALLLLRVRA